MACWQDLLDVNDRYVIEKSGWGKRRGFGKKPALLIIDAQNSFVGEKVNQGNYLEKYPSGCGQAGWDAVENIRMLLKSCREGQLPILFTQTGRNKDQMQFYIGTYKKEIRKKTGHSKDTISPIVELLKPKAGEWVIQKQYPSAFFGTPLLSYLNQLQIDTLIVVGFVTSGCIRATVVDAASYNYNTIVVEECVADRLIISHKVNLLDMDLKYADVISLKECIDFLDSYDN